MLVPLSAINGAIPSSFNRCLRINSKGKSDLVDGIVMNEDSGRDLLLDLSRIRRPVFVWSEDILWLLPWPNANWERFDTIDLSVSKWKKVIHSLLDALPEAVFILMDIRLWLSFEFNAQIKQIEQCKNFLLWLRQKAKELNICIVHLRFCSKHRRTWGEQTTIPRHPIQHHRDRKQILFTEPI